MIDKYCARCEARIDKKDLLCKECEFFIKIGSKPEDKRWLRILRRFLKKAA